MNTYTVYDSRGANTLALQAIMKKVCMEYNNLCVSSFAYLQSGLNKTVVGQFSFRGSLLIRKQIGIFDKERLQTEYVFIHN